MRHIVFFIFCLLQISGISQSAAKPLNYYLPDIPYNPNIPTPEQYLGFQMGEWHVTHDQLTGYFKALDAASDRVEISEYARTHENRQLFIAMISSPANLKNKDSIKKQHADLSNTNTASAVDINNLPAILWHGYTIHGNEPSGNNAAMLVAYYLAAGQSREVMETLEKTIILMDPCLNPDGAQRFSTWVNSHKSKNLVSDPASREFSETWPGGRFNHYWFDMNRDWLLLIQPESRGRIKLMHEWHPNVLTDYHEMGTNSTYFFQPGVPSSNNPNTPNENFELTEAIGKFHAKGLDSIGSLYYTKYRFDDFYYGKGSTYPDAMGAIGILFEQASSRGHLQESINGLVSFPFTIRNQIVTSLSSQKATVALKDKILKYKQGFHAQVVQNVKKEAIKAYLFTDTDKVKLNKFLDVLLQHKVDVYKNEQNQTLNGQTFAKDDSYIVPLDQAQPILAKTIFEEVKSFKDSSFYDVSGWTMSYAYGLQTAAITTADIKKGQKMNTLPTLKGQLAGATKDIYAYIIPSGQYELHKAVYHLQSKGINVRINQADLDLNVDESNVKCMKGSAIIPVMNQNMTKETLHETIKNTIENITVTIISLNSGNGTESMTLGHPLATPVNKPEIAFITGNGISPQSAGVIWHHADLNLNIPITMLENNRFRTVKLQRYNTLVLTSGNYGSWNDSEANKIKEWVQEGNTLIVMDEAISWVNDKKITSLTLRNSDKSEFSSGKYENNEKEYGARQIGGTVMSVDIDQSHPLFYGVPQSKMYVMKDGTWFYEPTQNKFATPARYSQDFLASGYLPKGIEATVKGAANVTVHRSGQGKIICFHSDPLFRGYWLSWEKVFNNAIFFGHVIESRTAGSDE